MFKRSLLLACLCALPAQAKEQKEYIMGTLFTVEAYHESAPLLDTAISAAFAEIRAVDQALSDYKSDSELALLERPPFKKAKATSEIMHKSLLEAQKWHRKSGGSFDITVGPLVRLWGFKDKVFYHPSESERKRAQEYVGFQYLEIAQYSLRFKRRVSLDFGALGKGIAIDRAVQILREKGITSARIDSGSTAYYLGQPPGRPYWTAALKHPRTQVVLKTFALQNQAISTSGDDQQYFESKGQRYGHIVNPLTGTPISKSGLHTAVASRASSADALSSIGLLNANWKALFKTEGAQGCQILAPEWVLDCL